jgi:hypothetical protein
VAVIIFFVVALNVRHAPPVLPAGVVVVIVFYLSKRSQAVKKTRSAVMTIDGQAITVEGKYRKASVSFGIDQIRSFGFRPGGEGSVDGIWINTGHFSDHFLLSVSRNQAKTIQEAVARKFPALSAKAK